MNTAAINSPLDDFASGTYPINRDRSLDELAAESRHTRSVALGGFLAGAVNSVGSSVAMVGSAVFEQIYRMIRALMAKIARFFNVQMDMPEEAPRSQAELNAAAASFAGEQDAVEGASAEAEELLAQKVSQLSAERINATTLVDAHGDKYLSFKLQDVGETAARLESALAEKESQLAGTLIEFAQKYEMSVDAAVHLLKSESVPRAEKDRNFPPASLALLDEIEGLNGDLAAIQMRFCTYAALGVRLGAQEGREELRAVSEAFISRFANDAMRKSIDELALEEAPHQSQEISPKLGSLDVNSSKYDNNNVVSLVPRAAPPAAEVQVSSPPASLSRSQRFGAVGDVGPDDASTGVDAGDFEDDASAAAQRPRSR